MDRDPAYLGRRGSKPSSIASRRTLVYGVLIGGLTSLGSYLLLYQSNGITFLFPILVVAIGLGALLGGLVAHFGPRWIRYRIVILVLVTLLGALSPVLTLWVLVLVLGSGG